jgi:glycosyltransferase involved in cell wall biosynthesis
MDARVAPDPRVSVVVATYDRPERLERALAALYAQTLPSDAYEIVVVDDGSGPETAAVLRRFQAANDNGPALMVLRQVPARGPAAARNRGWRSVRAPLVAFTDDDCEATSGWLAGLVAAADANRGAIVQGPTLPNPAERDERLSFFRTLSRTRLGPWFETANILYPRAALQKAGGFDEAMFSGAGGEDTDLAWRAIEAGATAAWAPGAIVCHAVTRSGPLALLRHAWHWDETMLCFKRHPVLRRELVWGVFWTREHALLSLAVVAIAAPKLPPAVRVALGAPYARRLYAGRRTPLLAPFRLALDLVETAACARGALRFRVLVL